MAERRVFAGPAVRKVRREAAMTQAAMAEALDISPSYLNLIEHGQRPLSATVIVRLAERFGFDAAKLGADEVPGGLAGLRRRLADPRFADLGIGAPRLDHVRLSDLQSIRGPRNLRVLRDTHFVPKRPLSEYVRRAEADGSIND